MDFSPEVTSHFISVWCLRVVWDSKLCIESLDVLLEWCPHCILVAFLTDSKPWCCRESLRVTFT